MNILDQKSDCYGCGVCAAACAKKLISLSLNKEGFYVPKIEREDRCVNCGACLEVCSFAHDSLAISNNPLSCKAVWSHDENIRKRCSSGGIGYEISRYLIGKGYKVCAVRYNAEKNRAEHYIATNEHELLASTGSKYIQSFTVDGFCSIKRNERYLVVGSPCQIDSFRRYIRKFKCEDNFVLLDFFCHGVPSKLIWDKYIDEKKNRVGEISFASWRNKFLGWNDCLTESINGLENEKSIDWHQSFNILVKGDYAYENGRGCDWDPFYKLFFSDVCLNKACYKSCKFKMNHSSADLRIGDFWGKTFQNDKLGVSNLLIFTAKGCEIINEIDCHKEEFPYSTVIEGQQKCKLKESYFLRKIVFYKIRAGHSLTSCVMVLKPLLRWKFVKSRLLNPKRTLNGLLKRLMRL